MNIAIQGMRRSSTTFLFDVLSADRRFTTWYEPLAAAQRKAVGGGSRMRDEDFFAPLREARRRFRSGSEDDGSLNWGGPTDFDREIEPGLPDDVAAYLRFLMDSNEDSLLKFVRAWRKIPDLLRIDPDLLVLHIVRDPRDVATSFLYGKGRKHAAAFTEEDSFFRHPEGGGPRALQGVTLADRLVERGEIDCDPSAPTFEKLLALWDLHYRATIEDLHDRSITIRHEDLVIEPGATLDRIDALLDQPLSDSSRRWIARNVQAQRRVHHLEHPAWAAAARRLGVDETMTKLGYHL